MRSLKIAFTVLLCCCFVNYSNAQAKKAASEAPSKAPYKAMYTSSFAMGKKAQADIVLNLWKDWDDNAFDRHDYFADTIKLILSDSMVIKGKADAIEGAKKYRGAMSSCKSVVHAWIPLHSTDKNEDMVCIWGTETDTYPDGRVETKDLHEVWWFNKAGKVSSMRQWTAKFAE